MTVVIDMDDVMGYASGCDFCISGQDFILGKEPFGPFFVNIKSVSQDAVGSLLLEIDMLEGCVQ